MSCPVACHHYASVPVVLIAKVVLHDVNLTTWLRHGFSFAMCLSSGCTTLQQWKPIRVRQTDLLLTPKAEALFLADHMVFMQAVEGFDSSVGTTDPIHHDEVW